MPKAHLDLSRRHLLGAFALGGAAATFPSLGKRANAAPAIPKRLVLMFTGHSTLYRAWKMRRPGLAAGDWEFDLNPLSKSEFSEIYQPLWDYRKNLLILDTLSNAVNLAQPDSRGHFGGPSTVFTSCNYAGDAKIAGGPSIDQIVAEKVAVPGRLRSLELGTASSSLAIWLGQGKKAPIASDPASAFARAFPMGIPTMSAPSVMPAAPSREAKIAMARVSAVDYAKRTYEAVLPRMSGQERMRLEAHRDLLRDLELKLADSGAGGGASGPSCKSLGAISSGTSRATKIDNLARTITMAFACDRTRVASLQLHAGLSAKDFGASGDIHQDIAHHGDSAGSQQPLVNMYKMHANELATLLGHLRSIPESDGTTLLDHTTIVWVQECGSWMHDTSHLGVVVAGGGFKMGRYVHYDHDEDSAGAKGEDDYKKYGPAMSQLLVSIARHMGIDTDRIGNASSGFRGASVTGPLARLT